MAEGGARPTAAVFLDSENLFKPFSLTRRGNTDQKRAARHLWGGTPPEDNHLLGPVFLATIVHWTGARWNVPPGNGRSYGKSDDHGVQSVREPLIDRHRWIHIDVPDGDDVADDVIRLDVQAFAQLQQVDALVVGASDFRTVSALRDVLTAGATKHTVALLGPDDLGARRRAALTAVTEIVRLSELCNLTTRAPEVQEARRSAGKAAVQRERDRRQRFAVRVEDWTTWSLEEVAADLSHLFSTTRLPDDAARMLGTVERAVRDVEPPLATDYLTLAAEAHARRLAEQGVETDPE